MTSAQIAIMTTIILYLCLVIFTGVMIGKRSKKSAEGFYLGGRGMGPLVTAMSAEASDMSSYLLMGIPGLAYLSGVADASWTAIGLAIGGQTAPEIALSILAEIVQLKNSRQQTEGFPPALLNALDACAGQETPPVLVTIVSRHGSTPREVGAKMLMLPDGKCVGSVGGGIMEYRIQQLASKMQAGEAAPCQLAEYSASAQEDDAALAACGGSMKVFLQLLKEEKSDEA